ncbi:YcaO-like family protein [Allosalinactinospora lopnorensis]|uniref:YcaO-like family protein n=1 Tax=Allosalinactinospora lopnorensis TaxID=1352348 RepID=UPI000623BCAF|nr:YcaO-like family protein [Allosalinactinospora lopnorensis]
MTAPSLASRDWAGLPAGDGPPWTPAERSERLLRPLNSGVVGITTRLYRQMHDVDDVFAFAVGARACQSEYLVGEPCAQASGGGSLDERSATLSAIAETAERYSAVYWPAEHVARSSWADLTARGEAAIAPEQVRLFTDTQYADPRFPFVRFTRDTEISWVQGIDLRSGTPTWLPAALVFLSGPHRETGQKIANSTSNGLAAGCTWDEALCSGLLELVERDGFSTVWHNRLSMPLIDPDSDPGTKAFFDRHVRPSGLDVSLVDLSSFCGVPSVLTVVRNRVNEIAPLAVGGAAAGTAQRAIVKSVIEAFQTRVWMRAEQREGNLLPPDTDFAEQVHKFDDHVRLYAGPGLEHETGFLDASAERLAVAELPRLPDDRPRPLARAVLDRLGEQDVAVYLADATSPDIYDAGLVVARVFAPALVPLDSSYHARFIGPERLRRRPVELGLLERPLRDDELNPFPHPYP